MGLAHSPRIVTDGLVLCLDAANSKGYDRFENLALNSEAINSWANNGNAISVSANSQIAPDGTLTADTLAQTAVTGASRWVSSTTRTYTAGITYTLSIWLKKISGTQAQPTINLWVNGGTNQSVGTITTEWIRYSKSFTPSSTISSNTFSGLNIGWSDSGGANDFVFAAWGFQIEIGSFATDYYRTTSTAKSRGTIWGDLSGNANNGTLTNGPTYSSANGGSLVFDGVDDYIFMTGFPTANFMSISCWFKTSTQQNNKYLVAFGKNITAGSNGFDLTFQNTQIGSYMAVTGTGSGGNLYTINYYNSVWHYIVSTYDGSIGNFYYDGNLVAIKSGMSGNLDIELTKRLNIGSWVNNGSPASGNISNVNIYNRALTAQEVQQNFNATRGRYGI